MAIDVGMDEETPQRDWTNNFSFKNGSQEPKRILGIGDKPNRGRIHPQPIVQLEPRMLHIPCWNLCPVLWSECRCTGIPTSQSIQGRDRVMMPLVGDRAVNETVQVFHQSFLYRDTSIRMRSGLPLAVFK